MSLYPVLAQQTKSATTTIPQLVDITAKTGIHFTHLSSPDKKYIVESMSGGVALIDYDRDGYPDIFFTNAPDVAQSLNGVKARSALYHNNHNGTFTDVTEKAGVGHRAPVMELAGLVGIRRVEDEGTVNRRRSVVASANDIRVTLQHRSQRPRPGEVEVNLFINRKP